MGWRHVLVQPNTTTFPQTYVNAISIQVELVADERPNEAKASENDEGNDDTYNTNDDLNPTFVSTTKC